MGVGWGVPRCDRGNGHPTVEVPQPQGRGKLSLEVVVGKPLLDVLRDVVLDPAEQAAFTADPATYLAQYGYDDVPAEHLTEAFGLVADTLPPDVAHAVADASAPVAQPVGDDTAAFDAATTETFGAFGAVTTELPDDVDPAVDDVDDVDPDDDLSAGFGEGEVDDTSFDEATITDDFDDTADAWGTPTDDGGFEADLADDGLGTLAEPDLVPEHHDAPLHDDLDDADDVPDQTLGDDPGDFLDDIGSF